MPPDLTCQLFDASYDSVVVPTSNLATISVAPHKTFVSSHSAVRAVPVAMF